MKDKRMHMLEVLRFNKGFTSPEEWIDFGIRNDFKKIQADKLEACPDCCARSSRSVGQFIYYSTLVKLQSCTDCGLIFVDTRIDSRVIQSHFENAYKDENYFLRKRRRVFDQLSGMISRAAPPGGRVLDIGGAKGHLMALLKEQRPDLRPVVHDLSAEACAYAAATFGLETIVGDVRTLEEMDGRYDVVVLSDVAYYEPDIKRLWDLLPRLLAPHGTVILRVPNKLPLIRLWQNILRLARRWGRMQKCVKFFNPEHLYVFSRCYLKTRLGKIGFTQIHFSPSELLIGDDETSTCQLVYRGAQALSIFSLGRMIITPSLLVTASGWQKAAASIRKDYGVDR